MTHAVRWMSKQHTKYVAMKHNIAPHHLHIGTIPALTDPSCPLDLCAVDGTVTINITGVIYLLWPRPQGTRQNLPTCFCCTHHIYRYYYSWFPNISRAWSHSRGPWRANGSHLWWLPSQGTQQKNVFNFRSEARWYLSQKKTPDCTQHQLHPTAPLQSYGSTLHISHHNIWSVFAPRQTYYDNVKKNTRQCTGQYYSAVLLLR